MKSSKFLLILTYLVLIIHSIDFNGQVHLQSTFEQQAYLNQLIQIQNALQNQVLELEKLVTSVNGNVSSLEEYPNIQSQALQAGLYEERLQLYKINSQLVIPLNQKKWDCQLLTQTEAGALNQQISNTQKNIEILKQKMAAQSKCEKNKEIQFQIEYLNMYLDHLAKEVKDNCGSTSINAKTVLVPNSQNKFFIYGSQTQQSYQTNLQNLLDQGYTKLECPPQSPYPKGNSCVSCPQDRAHFYDLTKLLCVSCPNGYMFQPLNHTCLRKKINSNPEGQNYIGPFPSLSEDIDTCPSSAPFFNGTACIGCPKSSFFDFLRMKCQTCPSGTVFDSTTHLCVNKKLNSNINANSTNYCCGTLPHDPNAETCPSQTPFFNGQQCVGCQNPAYFSLQTMSCSLCPQGQGFSLVQRRCIDSKYLQIVFTSALSPQTQNYVGNPPLNEQFYEKISPCPSDQPFFNGKICVACSLPNYFNFQSKNCEICPSQFRFNTKKKQCVKFSSQQMNNNMAVINNYIGNIPNFSSQLATCPDDQPLFNGEQCMACNIPNYFDFNTMTCKSCKPNYIFMSYNRECVIAYPNFYTDVNANNIFFNGDFNTVKQSINTLRYQNPQIQQCLPQKPYFDATQGICIICPTNYPLFDYKYNRCVACADQSTFNPVSRICLYNGKVFPTAERIIMNTNSWI